MLSLDPRQSNGIQLSPEDSPIIAGCSAQATVRDSKRNPSSRLYPAPPAGGSSIAHIGADIHVIAAKASILHVVTPKATKVKAAGDRLGCTVFLFNSIEPNSGDAILQPVLQYGGGAFWTLATWVRQLVSFHWTPHPPLLVPRRRPNLLHHPRVRLRARDARRRHHSHLPLRRLLRLYLVLQQRRQHVAQHHRCRAAHPGHPDTFEAYGVTSASD
ncbi:hypothetical protein C8R44DRAFT_858749, partial [Mycena epipterygia]